MDEAIAREYANQFLGKCINGWKVGDLKGFGKSAAVFKCEKAGLVAAVKIFDKAIVARYGKDTQIGRIEREKSLIGKSHPHLVEILDGGYFNEHDCLFVIMEYLDYQSLSSVLDKVPRDLIWPIVGQVASAAKYLETLGLAHRDIKPQNIVVSANFDHVKLLDLGVIRPFGESDLTGEDGETPFIGTQRYASPEYFMSDVDDSKIGWRAVTFYQLGGVLYDLIERRPLFEEYSVPYGKLANAIQNTDPAYQATDVDPQLRHIAKNCLVKNPRTRLTILNWDHFTKSLPSKGSFESGIRERVRQRIARLSSTGDTIQAPPSEHTFLNKVTHDYISILRQKIIDNNYFFPPMHISNQEFDQDVATITFTFESSGQHLLPNGLTVLSRLKLLDRNAEIISIRLAACNYVIDEGALDIEKYWIPIYEGVKDDDAIQQRLDIVIRLLDQVHIDNETNPDSHSWVELPNT